MEKCQVSKTKQERRMEHQHKRRMNKRGLVPEASVFAGIFLWGVIVLGPWIIPEGNRRAAKKVKEMMPKSTVQLETLSKENCLFSEITFVCICVCFILFVLFWFFNFAWFLECSERPFP